MAWGKWVPFTYSAEIQCTRKGYNSFPQPLPLLNFSLKKKIPLGLWKNHFLALYDSGSQAGGCSPPFKVLLFLCMDAANWPPLPQRLWLNTYRRIWSHVLLDCPSQIRLWQGAKVWLLLLQRDFCMNPHRCELHFGLAVSVRLPVESLHSALLAH